MLRDCIISGFRNLGRKKFRSFLTISSIAIGVASVVLVSCIGRIGHQAISTELGSLGIGSITVSADKKLTTEKMTADDLELILKNENVVSVSPLIATYGSIRMRGLVANAVLMGMNGESSGVVELTPKYGHMITQADVAAALDVCVVDSNAAKLFYGRENIVGKTLDAMIADSYVTLEIIGVADSGGSIMQSVVSDIAPSFVYIPYSTIQRYKGEQNFDSVAVTLVEECDVQAVSTQITAALNRRHNISRGFSSENVAKQKDALNNVLSIVTMILSAVAGVSLVVAGLGIMTIMVVCVNERTREIGIKKSIGAPSRVILVEFLLEALMISLLGSLCGIAAGLLITFAGCSIFGIDMLVDTNMLLVCIVVTIFVGVVFGAYPASLAAKMKPVDALRTE